MPPCSELSILVVRDYNINSLCRGVHKGMLEYIIDLYKGLG